MKKLVLLLVAALGLVLVAAACAAEKEAEVKAGFNMAVAGVFAPVGDPQKKAVDLVVDEINKAGGILGRKVKAIIYDNEGDQAKAEQLALRLVDQDKVDVAFGPNITPPALVVAPLMERKKQLTIIWVAQQYLANGTRYIFQSTPAQYTNAEAMVGFAKNKLGAKKVALLYANVPYGQDGQKFIVDNVKKLGLEMVAEDKWDEVGFSFTPQVTKVINAKPDAIFVWGSAANADGLIIKQLREAGWKGSLIGDIAISLPFIFGTAGVENMEGLYTFSWVNFENPDKETREFRDKYKAKYGEDPTFLATPVWDGMMLYKAAVEKAKSFDKAKVAEALETLQYKGVPGLYKFSKDNHTGISPDAYKPVQAKGGKYVFITP